MRPLNLRQWLALALVTLGIGGLFNLAVSWMRPGRTVPSEGAMSSAIPTSCRVIKLYDGDTLGCDANGNGRIDDQREHIRLIGMDAPEMAYSRKNHSGRNEPYAQAAMHFVETHAMSKRVRLEMDAEPYDRYGRLLAYVYPPEERQSLNQQLLAAGLARHMFIEPNTRYRAAWLRSEDEARLAHRGLWRK